MSVTTEEKGPTPMRIARRVRAVVGLLSIALLSGGCVSKSEYDRVFALNRKAQTQLAECREAVDELRAAGASRAELLAAKENELLRRQERIDSLEQSNRLLEQKYIELSKRAEGAVQGVQPPTLGPIRILPEKLDTALKQFASENPDLVVYFPKRGMLKFKADLTFDKGSDLVSREAEQALGTFAQIVTSDLGEQFNVYIAGHTDDLPIVKRETRDLHPDNWYLSVHRAVAVQEILTEAGVDPERIGAMGFGQYHPVAPNKPGNKGNPLNRRVEIWLVPPDRYLTTEADLATDGADVPPLD
jgi:chemotaxis protein MotB